jgi:hypothetical protein
MMNLHDGLRCTACVGGSTRALLHAARVVDIVARALRAPTHTHTMRRRQGRRRSAACSDRFTVDRIGSQAVLMEQRQVVRPTEARAPARLTLPSGFGRCVSSARSMAEPRTGVLESSDPVRLCANREAMFAHRSGREPRRSRVDLLALPAPPAWRGASPASGRRGLHRRQGARCNRTVVT